MKRTRTSKAWMREHVNDPFVQQAQKDGYRSRAAYKLLAIDAKDRLFKPGMVIADLGSAPGSWSQVAVQKLGRHGQIFALDILPMDPLPGVQFIQGNFREDVALAELTALLNGQALDLVISDLAPNMSGKPGIDMPRSFLLAEMALEFALSQLKPEGVFLVKVFQGSGFEAYVKLLREHFALVQTRKPDASRDRSREVYLLAKNRRVNTDDRSQTV
jgi:23S rRNA (uridine2552-2'-O)-methyltransferase